MYFHNKNKYFKLFIILLYLYTSVSFTESQIELKKGWNLISIPLRSTQTVDDLFGELKTGSAWGFENDEYIIVENSDTLQPGKGYWIYTKSNGFSPEITGVTVNPDLDINAGKWSLIGLSEGQIFDFLRNIALCQWNGYYYLHIKPLSAQLTLGYWLFARRGLSIPKNFDLTARIDKTVITPDNNYYTFPYNPFVTEDKKLCKKQQ